MEFIDTIPVTFKEITPNYNIPEKWKEIVLNTGNNEIRFRNTQLQYKTTSKVLDKRLHLLVFILGGTHSTLQDIKLPHKAGGYWYKDSKKANTRNRFIYW